jgi:hypothetical protein
LAGPAVLGLDVGGVLVDRIAENADTSLFGMLPMDTPMVPGALEAVVQLAGVFEYRLVVVSKAGPRIADLTRRWLVEVGFFESAIDPNSVHFVRRREDKAPVCAELAVTHFVDDRIDVLQYLDSVSYRYLFVGGLGPNRVPAQDHLRGVVKATTWPEAADLIVATIEALDARGPR